MKRFKFDVIGISEVHWAGKGETPSGDFIWPGEDTTHTRGVGMLLSAKAKKTLIGYNPISSRVITARFNATPFKLTVIHVYAPTSASSDDEIEIFYDSIEQALTPTPQKDIIIVTGDWNAKIGSDNTHWESVMGRYGYGDRNERGDRLLEFAALHNLYICNTRFQQTANRKWTWASPDGVHKNMIDLVLIQKRWKSPVTNCRTFQSADISSGHSLVLCNIKLRLKRRCTSRNSFTDLMLQDIRAMEQSKEGVKQRWTQYCSGLYKDEGGGDEMVKELEGIFPSYEEDPQDILYSEVEEAIRTLKSNKIPGSDGITAEMIQAGGEQLTHEIHSLCNKAWHEGVIPESYGVENKVITLLKHIYEKAQSAVRVEKETGEWFQTSVGSRQGYPLSPLLFITYLERVMDKAMQINRGINISGTLVNNLRFADDIDVLEEDCDSLHQQIEQLRVAAEEAGLLMNTKKTKTLVFGDRNIEKHVQIAGNIIENVEQFEYLGSLLTWDNNCSDEIKRRIGKSIGAMAALK
ncbi:unnamed protein product, partial [Rotaria socialis]